MNKLSINSSFLKDIIKNIFKPFPHLPIAHEMNDRINAASQESCVIEPAI